ncbi:hypothetical protein BC941DRAFT_493628 [Chlamydoabsidia padenii]|nr:hypothetical protein BC941DRAFT_493628 [Chlamydoabsidia padenii]
MSQLTDQVKSFKKSLNANTMLNVKRTATASSSMDERKKSYATISNNTRASFDGEKRKKPKKTGTYSQPADTGTGTHAMSQLYTVIQFLKDSDGPQSVVSITSRTKINIAKNQLLWDKLASNDKIDYDPTAQTFCYKPTFQIKSKDDLITLLTTNRGTGGMDYRDLKDSYSKLNETVEELADKGLIMVVRNKDGNPRVLFHNEPDQNTHMDQNFKTMWSDIKIPDETDLPKELENAGLKTMDVFENKVVAEPKVKRSKTRNKRIKITNTHLSHIDLSKDYVPKK